MDIIDSHVYIGDGRHMSFDTDSLLSQMDEAGIAHAVACPVDRCIAVHNREGNNTILDAVRSHPDRISGMAVANPWFEVKAVEELERALGEGLMGLFLYPNYQGFRLSDHIVDPLLTLAEAFEVPVYAHSGTAAIAEPFHVAELARRFPTVNFIMGHAGSSDFGEDAVRALEFCDNVWLESSRNGPANYGLWQVRGCTGRVLFGSSAPEYIPAIEIETLSDVFTDTADRESILSGAVRSVFKGRLPL